MKENDGSGEDFLDLLLSTNANWSKDVGLNQKKNRYFLCLCAFISAGQNLLQVSDSSRRQLDELKTWLNVRHKPHTRGEKILLFQRSSSKSLIQVSCMVKTLWSQCIIMMKLFFCLTQCPLVFPQHVKTNRPHYLTFHCFILVSY